MQLQQLKKLLAPILMSTSVLAAPSPSSCEYYQDLEVRFHCGKQGYPLGFGKPLCEKYLKAQDSSPPNVREWYPRVRFCLQDYLHQNAHRTLDCKSLADMAYESHVKCYLSTGFCALHTSDVANILKTTGLYLLNHHVMSIGAQVSKKCL